MSKYHVIERARGTRYMVTEAEWSTDPLEAAEFTKEEAQRHADALNQKHAAESHWCGYSIRPVTSQSSEAKSHL